MAIETEDDLGLFFDTDDFGTEVTASVEGVPFSFDAVFTDAQDPMSPGIRANITSATPRLICRRIDAERMKRDQVLTVNGKNYIAKNTELRGAIATIFLKEA